MITHLRERFNSEFTEQKHARVLKELESLVASPIQFRVAETPVFLPLELVRGIEGASMALIEQLDTPAYRAASDAAVPAAYAVQREDAHPTFIVIDFAITAGPDGALRPKLIELQGFPSLFGFQSFIPKVFQEVYGLRELPYFLGGLVEADYVPLLRRAIRGRHAPENVILTDLRPLEQKTYPDFACTEKLTGVKPVCITDLVKRGRKLYYKPDGRGEIPIHRIYNRTIIDELERKGVVLPFSFTDDLDVEWAGHPNWYFRWSKFSLPFLNHPTVPRAWLLSQLDRYPDDLESFVLKPLFSFAGTGVKVDVTRADLDAIPEKERPGYLLQEKVSYGGLIKTLDEPSKVEIRAMFIWIDRPVAITTLPRMSKGKMMGVDFNKNKTWVGSSCCFWA